MGERAIYISAFYTFVWAAIAFLQLYANNLRYHIPSSSVIIAITSGLIAGALCGVAVTRRQLQFLTKKGETRVTLITWLYIIGALFITIGVVFFFVTSVPTETVIIATYFMATMVSASEAARTILFVNWERKHKRIILLPGVVSNKMYVFPKIEETQPS
jgi:ammonia channel protein AmtB